MNDSTPDTPDAGNWNARGFENAAPNADVVKYLGKENDGHPVTIGILRQLAALDDSGWGSDEVWRDISGQNRDAFSDGAEHAGHDFDPTSVPDIKRPASRPVKRTELSGGVYGK